MIVCLYSLHSSKCPRVQQPYPAPDVISSIEQLFSRGWCKNKNILNLSCFGLRKCFIVLACWFSSVYFICIEKQKDIWDECYDGGGYDRTAARRNITCLLDNGLSVSQTFTRNLNLTLGMFSLSRPSASQESKYEMELIKHVPDRLCILRDTGIILSYLHRTLGPLYHYQHSDKSTWWPRSRVARVFESQGSPGWNLISTLSRNI